MNTARRYTTMAAAAGILTALLALPAGTQNSPTIPDLDPAGCSNGTYRVGWLNDQQCRALVNLRNHWTRAPGNNLPANHPLLTWGTGDTWAGIDCCTEGEGGINVDLDLSGMQLTGTIPAEPIRQLASRDTWGDNLYLDLDLSDNKLTGPIPAELGQLILFDLDLSGNQLTGTIPAELGNPETSFLQLTLDLSNNKLTGTIPPQLGQLTRLTHLDLSNNQLTGTIPPQLGQITDLWQTEAGDILTTLSYLDLSNNQLTGTIPTELGQLTTQGKYDTWPRDLPDVTLEHLDLSNNKLTGTIPTQLSQLTNLETLNLSGNQLTGTIPTELARLTNLETLNLSGNLLCLTKFTGRFCDDDNSVHESSIETIARWGITQGCDRWTPRYCPRDQITRRQMAAFLHRAVTHQTGTEPTAPTAPPVLTDVESSSSLPYIQWAVAAGVIQAPEGIFNPRGKVTRADMAQMMAAAFDHITPTPRPPRRGIFTDMASQPAAVIRAAEALRTAGVTDGCSTSPLRYCPDQPVTRAQMASFFARALS